MLAAGVQEGQKMVLDTLKLELQDYKPPHVSTRN